MRAQLLLVKLPYSMEYLRAEIAALVASLPEGSEQVLYTDTLIGIAMPHVDIPEVTQVKIRNAMKAFSTYWIIGLNGQLVSKDRSIDPFRSWMNKHLGIQPAVRKPRNPQNMTQGERRQIRLKSAD